MANDRDEEIKIDEFGEEVQRYISLMQARLLAIRHAGENRDIYPSRYADTTLVWEQLSAEEDEDYYHIKLSWRPSGRFNGQPGVVEYYIDKIGTVEVSQLLDEPSSSDQVEIEREPSPVVEPPPTPNNLRFTKPAKPVICLISPGGLHWQDLPLRQAYKFGIDIGIEDDVDAIKDLEIEWNLSYTTTLRRGYVVDLFEGKGVFLDFINEHWPNGGTSDGQKRTRQYRAIKRRYEVFLSGADNSGVGLA